MRAAARQGSLAWAAKFEASHSGVQLSSTCHLGEGAARRFADLKVQTVAGGHFFPMERPDLVRDAILDAAV